MKSITTNMGKRDGLKWGSRVLSCAHARRRSEGGGAPLATLLTGVRMRYKRALRYIGGACKAWAPRDSEARGSRLRRVRCWRWELLAGAGRSAHLAPQPLSPEPESRRPAGVGRVT